jgi:hypothetical protein
MKLAICNFCDRSFRNTQAVRAHLKACPAYRRLPKATLPRVGNKPRTVGEPVSDPGVHSPWGGRSAAYPSPTPASPDRCRHRPEGQSLGAGPVDGSVGQGRGDQLMVAARSHPRPRPRPW